MTTTTTTPSVLPAKSAMAAYVLERTQRKAAPAEEHGVRAALPAAVTPRRAISEREKQLLRLVCDGQTNREMATGLGISTETVKSELKRIFRKLDVRNRTQAAVVLVRQGLD